MSCFISHLETVKWPSPTVWPFTPTRNHVHHALFLMRRTEARPATFKTIAWLPLAFRGRTPPTAHIDHGRPLVQRTELCLLTLLRKQAMIGMNTCHHEGNELSRALTTNRDINTRTPSLICRTQNDVAGEVILGVKESHLIVLPLCQGERFTLTSISMSVRTRIHLRWDDVCLRQNRPKEQVSLHY